MRRKRKKKSKPTDLHGEHSGLTTVHMLVKILQTFSQTRPHTVCSVTRTDFNNVPLTSLPRQRTQVSTPSFPHKRSRASTASSSPAGGSLGCREQRKGTGQVLGRGGQSIVLDKRYFNAAQEVGRPLGAGRQGGGPMPTRSPDFSEEATVKSGPSPRGEEGARERGCRFRQGQGQVSRSPEVKISLRRTTTTKNGGGWGVGRGQTSVRLFTFSCCTSGVVRPGPSRE